MLSLDFMLLVQQEHYRDLLREVERERLIRAVGARQPGNRGVHQKVTGWIGTQMVRWGCELQGYSAASPLGSQVAGCQ